MRRLIKSYKDQNLDTREQILMTAPVYPSFGHQNEFTESDEKSFSRMMNEPVIEKIEKEEREKRVSKSNNSRLKKVALMPTQMFQSQLDQISDKGRDVLKTLEEYKFFVEQTSRVMKNDPALTEVIMGKKKNLEEASTKIYDIVFDIENLDIAALYDRQQEVTDENQGIEQPKEETPEGPKLPDGPQVEKNNKEQSEQPKEEEKPEPSKSRLKQKPKEDKGEEETDSEETTKNDVKKDNEKDNKENSDKKEEEK